MSNMSNINNMYGSKVTTNFKGNSVNSGSSNVYYQNSSSNNYNNYNNNMNSNIWSNQSGYTNSMNSNMYNSYETVNSNNVNPYFQPSSLGEMYINNGNNIGYSMPVNLKGTTNGNSGTTKESKHSIPGLYDPKSK